MSAEKMSSDEVPGKFTEWLLTMGCPADIVPAQNKVIEMCRGQYFMVWRSLMEQVDVRSVVREKRMQVFCDDIRRCQENNIKRGSSTVVPEELSLWKQQTEVRRQREEAEARVVLARRDLNQLTDKISNKISESSLSRARVEATGRRVWLLRRGAAELGSRAEQLQETRAIAQELCKEQHDMDIQAKLETCLAAFRRQNSPQTLSTSNTSTSSANEADLEELVSQLVRSGGGALCGRLYEQRAALVKELSGPRAVEESPRRNKHQMTAQSVLAHTAALHCNLTLEATKNKVHLKQTQKKLLATITNLNSSLSGEPFELLAVRCERTHISARVAALRSLLDELTTRGGAWGGGETGGIRGGAGGARDVHKAIESKKAALQRVMSALHVCGRRLRATRECLETALAACRRDAPHYDGTQPDLPQEASLRQFYEERRERNRCRVNLSMELEASSGSMDEKENIDYSNPRFVDELRIYLKKFNLENNRQLVLESGEKIWIFETIQSSMQRLHTAWSAADVNCSALCLTSGPVAGASEIADAARARYELEAVIRGVRVRTETHSIDITPQKQEEQQITERIKKRLRENLLELQKTNKVFVLADENLKLWAQNEVRKYIKTSRKYDGMTYKDYEVYYLENCVNVYQ